MKVLFAKKKGLRIAFEFFMITIGAIIAAFAIEVFLVPNTILDGGMIGVGIIINNLSGVSLGLLTIVLNLPFILIGLKKMGKMFVIKSIYAMIVFSVFIEIFEGIYEATDEYLLAVSFGGVILGMGVGLVIRFGGCLDGTETVAILLNKRFDMPVGRTVLIFNIIIYSVASILFGFDRGMYSLLTYFVASKIIDIIESGPEKEKAALIITDDAEEIVENIYKRLGRTCTLMEGEGIVSGKKTVLYCVITTLEVFELKNIINELDDSAFVTISDVSEIIGKHVKSSKKLKEVEQNLSDK